MSKTKRSLLLIAYFLILFFVIKINATAIVEWLNKSMFPDYTIDSTQDFHDSFSNGISLIFISTIFLYSILGTAIVSILIIDILMIGLIFANQIKVVERNEFITFSEIKTVASPKELLSFVDVSPAFALVIVCTVILILAGLQFLIIKLSKKLHFYINKWIRVTLLLLSLTFLIMIFIKPNYYNAHLLKFEETHSHNFNPLKRARMDGFLPTFMHTVKPIYMDRPAGYNKVKIKEISQKHSKLSQRINKERDKSLNDSETLLYLSESFMDPKQLPGLLLNESPIPFITQTVKNNIGGSMYSQYIGGGTANLEWSVLTSFSLEVFNEPLVVTPYSDFYADSKNKHTILDFYDKEKVAVHPYTAHLYNRKTVYEKIGFDNFRYLNHGIKHTDKLGNHKRVSDEALNKDILDVMDKNNVGLIHILSMQNHSPYNKKIPEMGYKPEINTNIYPKKKAEGLFNYLQGIHATDNAIKDLVNELGKSNKDVNLLFYGDHYPSVFRGTENQFKGDELHHTPWFIFMNNGRSQEGMQLEDLSPAFFVPLLLKEGNYYVSPYQGLMNTLLTKGVKRIGKDYVVTNEGKLSDNQVPKDLLAMVNDYRIIQYDALFGHNWLADDFYTKVK
ncbi:sulfatase-like hydrolase/transferase [Virgibacillus halophilus]|uniref:Sulfatase-like hydrolase/transferase n=1 Tax=Tigheibacillus halophilus TaxID=361280 RepID=A0ABU5C469_9BACI|nr:sulfatase-like hydrolase/transferase [Virgibacillus halophilus]